MTTPITLSLADHPLQCLLRWENQAADRVYLTQPNGAGVLQTLTWREAADQVRRMAQFLQSQNWPPGSRVAILGKNSAHWILADLAIAMAGHISVPIYPTFNAESLSYILQHSESRACFVGKMDDLSSLNQVLSPELPLITLPLAPQVASAQAWDALVATHRPIANPARLHMEDVCTIIYTSGTTGKPKGVVHTFANMAWGVTSATRRVRMDHNDRYISYLPLAHVAERMLIEQASLRYGGQVFFAESLDTFVQDLQRARPSIFFSVPRLWVKFQHGVHTKMPAEKLNNLLRIPVLGYWVRRKILKGLGLDQCRIAAGGAAPMPHEVLRWYRNLGLDLIEVYGMTENCGISHSTLPGSRQVGTVGQTYDAVESRIDPINGEIQMRCSALMQGYYREPAQTAQVMTADGWLRTGDKGDINAQGQLTITGRVKDIFKTSKGKYVAPAPIEDLLVMHPAIEACAVTGANLTQPLALVMLSVEAANQCASEDDKAPMEESLERHLKWVNAQLEPHERLDCLGVVVTPWTPENGFVTPTLKVKRHRVEAAYGKNYAFWIRQGRPVVWVEDTL
ncbi:MAG: AMP-binding protein [Rhodoferax sp.]|nr:AMP-binding protein [Rhodoferax sp.]